MSNQSTSPLLKWIYAIFGIMILGAVALVLYATYPTEDYRVARELESRGFDVHYTRQDSPVWPYPAYVSAQDQNITQDDFRLICQLLRLQSLSFARCDMSGLNLDGIGNCQELDSFQLGDVTGFQTSEIPKLTACPVFHAKFSSIGLNDSDLEHFAGFTQLEYLLLHDNAGITDAGLEHLEKIPSLLNLCLWKNIGITQEGVEEFKKKRPDVFVVFE
jgi:hypothetical protein